MSNLHEELTRLAENFGRCEAERDWCRANEHRNARLAGVDNQCLDKAYRLRGSLEKRVTEALLADGRCRAAHIRDTVEKWLEYGRRSVDAEAVARDMEEWLAERLPAWQATDEAITPPDVGGRYAQRK